MVDAVDETTSDWDHTKWGLSTIEDGSTKNPYDIPISYHHFFLLKSPLFGG